MKLDLRKTRAATVADQLDDADIFLDDADKKSFLSDLDLEVKDIIGLVLRLVVCGLGIVILIHFEQKNLDKLNGQRMIAQDELNSLKSKESKIKNEIKGLEKLSEKSKEFNHKLNIMQGIVDNRLLAVKGLDLIQSAIPEEVWLREVSLKKKKFIIKGVSTTNKQIQNFIEQLEDTDLFSAVSLAKAGEEKKEAFYSRRRFTIESLLK